MPHFVLQKALAAADAALGDYFVYARAARPRARPRSAQTG